MQPWKIRTLRGNMRISLIILLLTNLVCFLCLILKLCDNPAHRIIDCKFDIRNYLLYVSSDFKSFNHSLLTPYCKKLMNNASLVKVVMFTDGNEIDQGCNATTARCPERAHFDKDINLTVYAPPCCRKHVVEVYQQVIDLFEKYDITYALYGGSVLGMVRHKGKMIPYDDDIDIAADIRDRPAFYMFVVPELLKSGRVVADVGYRRQYHIRYSKLNTVAVDIFWYILKNASYMDTFVSWVSPQLYFPLQTMLFEGRLVKVPRNVTGYLNFDYGKNWMDTRECKHRSGHNCGD